MPKKVKKNAIYYDKTQQAFFLCAFYAFDLVLER